jgi:signal transduction histidine kinase
MPKDIDDSQLAIANKELAFQNEEKEKRASELAIANKELTFQNEEKEKRAAELVIANKELAFQNEEKEKRAAELVIANKELAFQNKEKEKRAVELALANKELAFQKALLQSAIDIMPVGLWIFNAEGKIVSSSAAAQRIWAGVRYVGVDQLGEYKGWRTDSGKPIGAHEWAGARALEKGETSIEEEVEIECFDGTHKIILDSAVPLRKSDGSIGGAITINQDITDRKLAEDERIKLQTQLAQAQKLESVGRLAGGVAHDFNNLLGAILGYGKFLADAIPAGDPKLADLDEIIKAGERAVGLTRQLLAFSRKQVLKPQPLSPDTAVSALVKMLRRLIGEHIEVKALLNAPQAMIMADPTQFDQVLMNLAVNGRDAMPDGGSLTIETEIVDLAERDRGTHPDLNPGRYAVVKISDTGSGLSAEAKKHLFEPFFTTKGLGRGTGLGLSTVYGIMKQSGGDISVYSEECCGTVFKLYFPLTEVKAEAGVRKEPRPLPRARGGEKILVVEDDAAVRRLTARILEESGYTVLQAALPENALDLCRDGAEISLMLTDVIMPQMSGWELAEKVRELRPGLRIIFTSGYTDDTLVGHKPPAEGAILLEKPVTAENLVIAVRAALDRV